MATSIGGKSTFWLRMNKESKKRDHKIRENEGIFKGFKS